MIWQLPWGRKIGTVPAGWEDIDLSYDYALHNYQDKWTWPWPPAPAHEQRSAITNCWTGNQMPGQVNFIPGVEQSKVLWNHSFAYQNNVPAPRRIGNIQLNPGMNIQTSTAIQSATWQMQAYQAWMNRIGGAM